MLLVASLPLLGGLTGCVSSSPQGEIPSVISMTPLGSFLVDGTLVSSENLIKTLKRNDIPTAAPLVIEIPAETSMETKRIVAGRLATAGYKPVFKLPRHAIATVKTVEPATPRLSNPTAPGSVSTKP